MENVILVIHLLLALSIISAVLLQRSEGGGLGIGGGGNGGASSRPAQTAAGKATWILAILFIITSIALTLISAQRTAGDSVFETGAINETGDANATEVDGESLLPSFDSDPLLPATE